MLLFGLVSLMPLVFLWWGDAPLMLSLILFFNLWILSLYDWHSFRLPNLLTLTLLLSGAVAAWLGVRYGLLHHAIGALVGGLFFPALNILYKRLRGRDGIGLGDAKLMAGIGLWLGWPALPPVLLVASVAGLCYGFLSLLITGGTVATLRIPFGPFLCLGAWVAWLWF